MDIYAFAKLNLLFDRLFGHLLLLKNSNKGVSVLIKKKKNFKERNRKVQPTLGVSTLTLRPYDLVLQLAEQLLERDASVNISDQYSSTPLHRAASKGHSKTVKLLLSYSADTNLQDSTGSTPL